jgi:hypothetical protein
MFVRTINIGRENDYGYGHFNPQAPFIAKIKVEGSSGNVELNLSPELSRRVVEIIAEEVAAAGRATAEAMTAEILSIPALASPEATL